MRCVYKITNKLNGLFYIGSTTRFKKRCSQWRDYTSNTNSLVKKDILKYGRDNFSIEPIEIFSNNVQSKEIKAKELEYIHALNPYYNSIGKPRSEETKRKLSLAIIGKKLSDEIRAKIREGQRLARIKRPQTNKGHLKYVILVEENKIIHGIKNVAKYFNVHSSSVTKAIKRKGTVKKVHVEFWNVETNRDECNGVG